MRPAHSLGRNIARGLDSITIGALSLTPTFENSVFEYTVNTSNASNKITATPIDAASDVVITNNGNVVNNGTSASWRNGENNVVIAVDGLEYHITVIRG